VNLATLDELGLTNAAVLDVSASSSGVRVWEEGRGDYRFELGNTGPDSVWWGSRSQQRDLPEVVLALALGQFEVTQGSVTVRL
jgi:hypothetical protein